MIKVGVEYEKIYFEILLFISGHSLWVCWGGLVQCHLLLRAMHHLDQFKGETLVEDAVDFRATRQLHCVHLIP